MESSVRHIEPSSLPVFNIEREMTVVMTENRAMSNDTQENLFLEHPRTSHRQASVLGGGGGGATSQISVVHLQKP